MADPFIGQIMQVGFNFAPKGWAQCAGQIMSIPQNSALFSLLGTTFGGNGVQTFGLPDARSRTFVGVGQGLGLSNYVWGEVTGTENNTILVSNMPVHNHPATFQGIQGATTATGSLAALSNATGQQGVPASTANQLANISPAGSTGAKIYAPAGNGGTSVNLAGLTINGGNFTPQGTVTVGPSGGSVPLNNIQPVLAVQTNISLQGIYPTRN
ncbi:phage tail protein [Sphingomonas sp. GlSt437]|uniref:phage tail protein n=1 Tax=Sphingomonas sp. GlSt437 TaxID=3389970 RepID=UPI003A88F9DF